MEGAFDFPYAYPFGDIIMPVDLNIDEYTGLVQSILFQPFSFKKNLTIQISVTAETKYVLKLLYANIIGLTYKDQWKIVGMALAASPEYHPEIINGMTYADLSKMSDMAISFMLKYVDWLIQSESLYQTQFMMFGLRREIISQVISIFNDHWQAFSLIIARYENRAGIVNIDENLKNITLRHLEKFCKIHAKKGSIFHI